MERRRLVAKLIIKQRITDLPRCRRAADAPSVTGLQRFQAEKVELVFSGLDCANKVCGMGLIDLKLKRFAIMRIAGFGIGQHTRKI